MNDQIVKQNYDIDLPASTPQILYSIGEDNAASEPEYLISPEHYAIWTTPHERWTLEKYQPMFSLRVHIHTSKLKL